MKASVVHALQHLLNPSNLMSNDLLVRNIWQETLGVDTHQTNKQKKSIKGLFLPRCEVVSTLTFGPLIVLFLTQITAWNTEC